jgi:catechol 2,3-dioxygenase-like lactoylglutathione lyase family enzyme
VPLPLKGLHHIAVLTKRLEESRAFYRDLLGFREIPRPPFNFAGAWLWNYGLQIHLIVDEQLGDPAGPIHTRGQHLAFQSPDVEAVEQVLAQRGIAFRVNIQAGTSLKQLFFRDPDGHHIEVASYGPTVEQGSTP